MSLDVKNLLNPGTLIIVVQDPISARSQDNSAKQNPGYPGFIDNFSAWDPKSLGSHDNVTVTGSKISKIQHENENIRSNIPDSGSWRSRIPDFYLGICLAEWSATLKCQETRTVNVAVLLLLEQLCLSVWTDRWMLAWLPLWHDKYKRFERLVNGNLLSDE